MKTPVQYGELWVEINKRCGLCKDSVQEPTGDESRAVVEMTGLSGEESADIFDLENAQIVRK